MIFGSKKSCFEKGMKKGDPMQGALNETGVKRTVNGKETDEIVGARGTTARVDVFECRLVIEKGVPLEDGRRKRRVRISDGRKCDEVRARGHDERLKREESLITLGAWEGQEKAELLH